MEDSLYSDISNFLLSGTGEKYPDRIYANVNLKDRKKQKHKFRMMANNYSIENGILHHCSKVTLRKSAIDTVMKAVHSNPTVGGHFGRDKTHKKITAEYFWKGMTEDISNYCKKCDVCCRFNPKTSSEAPPLNSIPVPPKVWSLVGIDIIGPLPKTTSGNQYIVAATDHFSKWPEAKAIPNKSSEEVVKFLYEIVCRLGIMDCLISDQGREFINKLIDGVTEKFDVEHRITSPYHPQSNGQRERDNRTLKASLQKAVSENEKDWDFYLPGVLYAYRTSEHASTKCTPFEVMYGRTAKLPVLGSVDNNDSQQPNMEEVTTAMNENITELHDAKNDVVTKNISNAQQRQKKNYDIQHKAHDSFAFGSYVLIRNSKRINRKGSKMEPLFIGPYEVTSQLGKGRVRLRNVQSGKLLKNVYHASGLKQYTADVKSQSDQPHANDSELPHDQKKKDTTSRKQSRKCDSGTPLERPSKRRCPTASSGTFSFRPTSMTARLNLCKRLKLHHSKHVSFGKSKKLGAPKCQHRVRGDGNCFFRCISFSLTGSEDESQSVRSKVVHHMQTKCSANMKDYLNENVKDYFNASGMINNGTWATDAEIIGTASWLNCDIYVYTRISDVIGHKWQKFPAGFKLDTETDSALYIVNNFDHFNAVLDVEDIL